MGKRTFMVFGSKFEVDERYTLIKPIGQGSYGIVCSARDALTDSKVAIKKVPKAFEDATDAKRLLREIRLLRHMEHENIINIKDMLVAKRIEDFNDVYIIQELMDTDLYQIICSPQPLSDDHHQYFLYQILRGLKYLHSANVLHRDLKPSNLLVNENCDLKICDFGLARVSSPDDFDTMTEYVVTRWYRPPELLLSAREYTSAVDVWSVGCIFAEMLLRKPFLPGKDYPHQLELITNVLGTPSEKDQAWITNEKARRFMSAMKRKAPQPLKKVFPKATDEALDLLEKMLAFDPAKRITVEGALAHPYLSSLHDADDEPIAPAPFKFEFEGKVLKENDIRKLVYEQAVQIHKEAKGKLKKSKS